MSTPKPADPAAEFERYRHDVYAWAYRLLGRHHDALDVAQDVFLRWVRQVRKAAPNHPRSWLRRVTINLAIDLRRATRPVPAAVEVDAQPGAKVEAGTIERDELRAAVAAAMTGLSEMQRSVLTAKVHDDLTFAQIAAEHGLAVPTVKTHYLRALRAVRDRLRSHWPHREGAER
jgi:RNA polymerase sigma-70 factor (ECF subfamily)